MKQNIYDDPAFYKSYINLREKGNGLNDVLEIPAFRSLLPDLNNKDVLDLGCGFGESCKWYVSQGARRVVGLDISGKMINRAKQAFNDKRIEYVNMPIENLDFGPDNFDLVLSSLAFHYIADFKTVVDRICTCLRPGGFLIFSQEHPVTTAKKLSGGWVKDQNGQKLHWMLDDYGEEGIRKQKWFVEGVIKYHRTLSTIINTLTETGFQICKVIEPTATAEAEKQNKTLKEERRRPPFLIVKALRLGK
ncbi:Ubiquinone/menaquinone biosynthesis C-methylase UbiE [Desulfotomaculum arcticum]|uniref:Ubiquinone/menaquinone biosynthesis C-methylase UbiE n=1 Tax=Desulfotruncus arcticus DSM 17038 TaxID=1121424 RepID=A0A1I2UPT4_9FIRM|nr:class I SAM-dependent methyltransferase [Desulfotruncus arcticus]SFG79083.1 Ubiquinone/menaquinone biosynthesis C-methylase UbiE [Desulfotomaculum arcticum] [Desulfotruncus arcticus DSM 17038]